MPQYVAQVDELAVQLELDGLYLFSARQHLKRTKPGKVRIRALTRRLIRLREELEGYLIAGKTEDGADVESSRLDYHDEILGVSLSMEESFYGLVRAFRPSWQHCAQTILLAALAIEAHMTRRIVELVKNTATRIKLIWTSPPSTKMQRTLTQLGKEMIPETDVTFQDYNQLVAYRNNLAHYKPVLMFHDDGRPPKSADRARAYPQRGSKGSAHR